MTTNNKTVLTKNLAEKKFRVTRTFDAPLAEVWSAWSESELLDQWWAPKPWRARTKTMDFREGGSWLYAMVSPDGMEHWARVDYKEISPLKSFRADDNFCDQEGNLNQDFPSMNWHCEFDERNSRTDVTVNISFAKEEDLQKILEMGFEQGFAAAHTNLDELLERKGSLV